MIHCFPYEDDPEVLVNAGLEGLATAARRFNLSREAEFSTYAVHWIESKMLRCWGNETGLIRIPIHVLELHSKLRQITDEYPLDDCRPEEIPQRKRARDTALEEVFARGLPGKLFLQPRTVGRGQSKIPVEDFVSFEAVKHRMGMTFQTYGFEELSLAEQEEFLSVPDNAPEGAQYADLSSTLTKMLDGLSSREQKVLQLRFFGPELTLREAAQCFDVTHERIRQIEAKALRKLRHPSRSEALQDFLEGDIG